MFHTFKHRTVLFGEYDCRGSGADYTNRAPYAKQLTESEAAPYLDASYIDGYSWLPNHQSIMLATF